MTGYGAALLLTLAVETPLYGIALHRWWHVHPARACAAGLLANVTSHPIAWLVLFRALEDVGALRAAMTAEAFVIAWEAAWMHIRFRRPWASLVVMSALINAVSLAVGGAILARVS